jgi:hypothetical protein
VRKINSFNQSAEHGSLVREKYQNNRTPKSLNRSFDHGGDAHDFISASPDWGLHTPTRSTHHSFTGDPEVFSSPRIVNATFGGDSSQFACSTPNNERSWFGGGGGTAVSLKRKAQEMRNGLPLKERLYECVQSAPLSDKVLKHLTVIVNIFFGEKNIN